MLLPPAKLHGVLDSPDPWLCDAPFASTRELEFEGTVRAQSRRNPHSWPRDAVRGGWETADLRRKVDSARRSLSHNAAPPAAVQPLRPGVPHFGLRHRLLLLHSVQVQPEPEGPAQGVRREHAEGGERGARDRAQDVPHRRAARAADPPNFAEPQGVEPLLRPDRRHHRGGGRRVRLRAAARALRRGELAARAHPARRREEAADRRHVVRVGVHADDGCAAGKPQKQTKPLPSQATTKPLPSHHQTRPLPNQPTPPRAQRSRRRRSRSRRSSSSCSAT